MVSRGPEDVEMAKAVKKSAPKKKPSRKPQPAQAEVALREMFSFPFWKSGDHSAEIAALLGLSVPAYAKLNDDLYEKFLALARNEENPHLPPPTATPDHIAEGMVSMIMRTLVKHKLRGPA